MASSLKSGKTTDMFREDVNAFARSDAVWGMADAKEYTEVFATHLDTRLGPGVTEEQRDAIAHAAALVHHGLTHDSRSIAVLAYDVNSVVDHESLSAIAAGLKETASPELQRAASDIARAGIVTETAQNLATVRETQEVPTGAEAVRVAARDLISNGRADELPDADSHIAERTGRIHISHADAEQGFNTVDIVVHEAGHAQSVFDANHKRDIEAVGERYNLSEGDRLILATYDTREKDSYPGLDKNAHGQSFSNLEETYADTNVVMHSLVLDGRDAALAKLDALANIREERAMNYIMARLETSLDDPINSFPLRSGHDTTEGLAYLRERIEQGAVTPESSLGEIRGAMTEAAVMGYLESLKESRYAEMNPVTLSSEGLRGGLPESLSREDVVVHDILGKVSMTDTQLDVRQGDMTVFVPLSSGGESSASFTPSPATARAIRDFGEVSDEAGNVYAVVVVPRNISEISVTVGDKSLSVAGGVGIYETPQGDYLAEKGISAERVATVENWKFGIQPQAASEPAADHNGGSLSQNSQEGREPTRPVSGEQTEQQASRSTSDTERSNQSNHQAQAEM